MEIISRDNVICKYLRNISFCFQVLSNSYQIITTRDFSEARAKIICDVPKTVPIPFSFCSLFVPETRGNEYFGHNTTKMNSLKGFCLCYCFFSSSDRNRNHTDLFSLVATQITPRVYISNMCGWTISPYITSCYCVHTLRRSEASKVVYSRFQINPRFLLPSNLTEFASLHSINFQSFGLVAHVLTTLSSIHLIHLNCAS